MHGRLVDAYIGLGSNIGERELYLKRAIDMLKDSEEVNVIAVSSFYNTAPVGYKEQSDFINAAVTIKTSLSADSLLNLCLKIEKELKRERIIHWGPRTIDLDILLYDNNIINSEYLTIPHPRMPERGFVLIPLNEIAPNVIHPVLKKTVSELLKIINGIN